MKIVGPVVEIKEENVTTFVELVDIAVEKDFRIVQKILLTLLIPGITRVFLAEMMVCVS